MRKMWGLHFRAQAGNITIETLLQWRKQDAEFDQLLQTGRLKAVEQRWKRIEKAAMGTEEYPPDRKADAWSLQRTYPQFFGRPDLQLLLNQNVSTAPTNLIILGPERAVLWQLAISKLEPGPCAVSSWESEELDQRPHALFLTAGRKSLGSG